MDNKKVVFVKAPKGETRRVSEFVNKIPSDHIYYFLVVEEGFDAISREDIELYHRTLGEVLERTGTSVTRRPITVAERIASRDKEIRDDKNK